MPSAEASGAICVQRFDGSRNSAIHTTYRISLRSSSIREPRYPLLRVVFGLSGQDRPEPQVASVKFVIWGVLRGWIQITDASPGPVKPRETPAGPESGSEEPLTGDRRPVGPQEGNPVGVTVGYQKWIRSIQ